MDNLHESSHWGHIAFVVLAFLIGGLVGFGMGSAYQQDYNSASQETPGYIQVVKNKPKAKPTASPTTSATPTPSASSSASASTTATP